MAESQTMQFDGFAFKERLAALQTKLLEKHPDMPILLKEVHTALRNNPEQVTLLTEEEMHVIIEGLERQTQTALISGAVTGKASKSVANKVKTLGVAAFGG